MKIKKVAHGFADVFVGEGWENWTRVRKIRTAEGFKVVHVRGRNLNRFQMNTLEKRI